MFLLAPTSRGVKGFFWGQDDRGREAGIWLLGGSLMMAWIFAKSVMNILMLSSAGSTLDSAFSSLSKMVMGLAPIFLLHRLEDVPRASFHLAFWPGILLSTLHAFGAIPSFLAIGQGKYADLLGVNLYGLLLCTGLFLVPVVLRALALRPVNVSAALE